jgi:hypothetical protein
MGQILIPEEREGFMTIIVEDRARNQWMRRESQKVIARKKRDALSG